MKVKRIGDTYNAFFFISAVLLEHILSQFVRSENLDVKL